MLIQEADKGNYEKWEEVGGRQVPILKNRT